MKLTDNQKVVIASLLSVVHLLDTVRRWEYKHDRHLVVDEIVDLCKKLKVTISKDHVKLLRDAADRGK